MDANTPAPVRRTVDTPAPSPLRPVPEKSANPAADLALAPHRRGGPSRAPSPLARRSAARRVGLRLWLSAVGSRSTGDVRGCAGGPVFTCRFRPSSAIHRLGGKPGVAGDWGEANNGQTDKDWLTLSPGGTIVTADKRRAIRIVLARLGMQAKPQEVVETLESYGVSVGPHLVRLVRSGSRWVRRGTRISVT